MLGPILVGSSRPLRQLDYLFAPLMQFATASAPTINENDAAEMNHAFAVSSIALQSPCEAHSDKIQIIDASTTREPIKERHIKISREALLPQKKIPAISPMMIIPARTTTITETTTMTIPHCT